MNDKKKYFFVFILPTFSLHFQTGIYRNYVEITTIISLTSEHEAIVYSINSGI